eukprot:NODE_46_length_32145_cov_0.918711.p17 type:complete len:236 gc:universal NODE_46_length_32145_cov_0.918711:24305-23598(-)
MTVFRKLFIYSFFVDKFFSEKELVVWHTLCYNGNELPNVQGKTRFVLFLETSFKMHGISKAIARASTQAMQGLGMADKTIDPKFDEDKTKLENLEKKIQSIVGSSKTLLDATRSVGIAQSDMSEMLYNLFDETDLKKPVAARYKLMIQQLDNEVRQALDEPFRKNIMDPVNKYAASFQFFDELIKKRGRKLIDYDAARTKVRKLSESPSNDATKMPAVLFTYLARARSAKNKTNL